MERFKAITSPVINWEIAAQPLNWVIIPLIVMFFGMALGLIFHPANTSSDD